MQIRPILGYFWAIFGLYQPPTPPPPFGSLPPFYISWISPCPSACRSLFWQKQGDTPYFWQKQGDTPLFWQKQGDTPLFWQKQGIWLCVGAQVPSLFFFKNICTSSLKIPGSTQECCKSTILLWKLIKK